MIALNPKCYFGECLGGKNKVSMKGVSHTTNTLTFEQYEQVLLRRRVHGREVRPQSCRLMAL